MYLIKSGVYDVMFCFVLKVKNSYAYVLTFYIKKCISHYYLYNIAIHETIVYLLQTSVDVSSVKLS